MVRQVGGLPLAVELLGGYFEVTCTTVVVIFAFITIVYGRKNLLFRR